MNDKKTDSLRFMRLLNIVYKEGHYLMQTDQRLFKSIIDNEWVSCLENNLDAAEQLDAFSARFSRMQDTLGDKLLPSMLQMLAEQSGSNLDNLNRIEKLGLLTSVTDWLEARNLRNKMVHEYMDDAAMLVMAVNRAHQLLPLLIETYNNINIYTKERFCQNSTAWPQTL